jgi:hypothetical protein
VELVHVAGLERDHAVEHGVENDSSRPNVGLVSNVPFIFKHLGRDVCRCATLFKHNFILFRDKFADSKVANLNVPRTS